MQASPSSTGQSRAPAVLERGISVWLVLVCAASFFYHPTALHILSSLLPGSLTFPYVPSFRLVFLSIQEVLGPALVHSCPGRLSVVFCIILCTLLYSVVPPSASSQDASPHSFTETLAPTANNPSTQANGTISQSNYIRQHSHLQILHTVNYLTRYRRVTL